MAFETSLTLSEEDVGDSGRRPPREVLALAIAWAADEPSRIGEIAVVAGGTATARILGRGGPTPEDGAPRLSFARARGGHVEVQPPLASARLSRVQLRVRARDDGGLDIESTGRLRLLRNGAAVTTVAAYPGDTLELGSQLLLLVVRRLFPAGSTATPAFPFGEADSDGIVGESAAAWAMRDRVAFVAPRPGHLLVHGPSGTGKELVARAVHAHSPRARKTLIARNAATIPEGLVDSELFGNVKSYPNPGMADRPGLIGDADGSTLFLDEFGELPSGAQAHLLRVLDGGEYQRLGDTRMRRSDFRLIAATNRAPEVLKEDVLARLVFRIELPSLAERREDLPLLARHLLRKIASSDRSLAQRWCDVGAGGAPEPRVGMGLVRALLRRAWTTNLRELEAVLWRAIESSTGDALEAAPIDTVPSEAASSDAPLGEVARPVAGTEEAEAGLTPERIQACLDAHNGVLEDAWRALGVANRHVLARLIRKHGIEVRRRPR